MPAERCFTAEVEHSLLKSQQICNRFLKIYWFVHLQHTTSGCLSPASELAPSYMWNPKMEELCKTWPKFPHVPPNPFLTRSQWPPFFRSLLFKRLCSPHHGCLFHYRRDNHHLHGDTTAWKSPYYNSAKCLRERIYTYHHSSHCVNFNKNFLCFCSSDLFTQYTFPGFPNLH